MSINPWRSTFVSLLVVGACCGWVIAVVIAWLLQH